MTDETVDNPTAGASADGASGRLLRTKDFLRKHQTFLAIAGSIIALASFAVREELQDKFREKLSTLRQAEFEYRRRADARSTKAMILMMLTSQPSSNPALKRSRDDDLRTEANEQFLDGKAVAADVQNLLHDADFENPRLQKEAQEITSSIDTAIGAESSEQRGAVTDDEADRISGRVRALQGATMSELSRYRESLLGNLRLSSGVGMIVFALGWLLSLLSNLVGKAEERTD